MAIFFQPQCLKMIFLFFQSNEFKYNKPLFTQKAKQWTEKHAKQEVIMFNWFINAYFKFMSSDAIWWNRYGLMFDQVMACCLTAPSHYLNQCWLIISEAHWHSAEGNFRGKYWKYQLMKCFTIMHLKSHPGLPGANALRKKKYYILKMSTPTVHETTGRPLAQFDLILNWTTWELLWAT